MLPIPIFLLDLLLADHLSPTTGPEAAKARADGSLCAPHGPEVIAGHDHARAEDGQDQRRDRE